MAVWRDISLIWLIFLQFVAVLPVGVLLFFAIKGMLRLRQLAVTYLPMAQEKAHWLAETSDRVCRKATAPVIGAGARAAQVRGIGQAIWRRKQA